MPPEEVPEFGIFVLVKDEAGAPIADAHVKFDGSDITTAADGTATLPSLKGPIAVVVSAPGFLDEPVLLDGSDAGTTQEIVLLARISGSGKTRVSLHLAGDVMCGRRYVTPLYDDTYIVTPGDGGASARSLVAKIAPVFRAADVQSANVESTIGTLPDSGKYLAKLFTIQSIPEITSMLDELGIDVAVLANNHIRDWMEPGIDSTTAALDAAGIGHCGAGTTEAAAAVPLMLTVSGRNVGFLCYSTINGDTANDPLPVDADPVPSPLPPEDAYKYEARSWGFTGPSVTIPTASRRIGSAWVEIKAADLPLLPSAESAAIWTSAVAVYPELQDWVARRGHGGANYFQNSRIGPDIAALRAAGADIVVVQVHSGFNTYDDYSGDSATDHAHAAIDAGADIVVGHHPHTLNGIEIYKGKLAVTSLGNFVFDQDFFPTYTSAFLRAVFEDDVLVDSRLVPMTIHRYRPLPVTGRASRDVKRFVHERSAVEAKLQRLSGKVAAVLLTPDPLAEKPEISLERHFVRLAAGPGLVSSLAVSAPAGGMQFLQDASLTRSRAPGGGSLPFAIEFGRDIFRWSDFEDFAADGDAQGGLFWRFPVDELDHKRAVTRGDAPSGLWTLFLHRNATDKTRTRVRHVSRMFIRDHRIYTDGGGVAVPADGPATWSICMTARMEGPGPLTINLDVGYFDTTVPNEEPVSIDIRSVEIPFDLPRDGDWHEVTVDIPASTWDPGPAGFPANVALLYIALYPDSGGDSDFYADDIRFMEWRDPAALPDFDFNVDAIRGKSGAAFSTTLERRDK